ncbi:condensation domain-containing protein, partial [Methylocucumis oryzae]|uniref:condensation domain-containing protein n=1 Tax=Methylocucumis oryzae TaxID=1632867 RepID=UPI00103F687B
MPKTSSGKLQRRACLTTWQTGELDVFAEFNGDTVQSVAVSVTSVNQTRMAAIWSEILQIPNIAPEHSFFALGGESIAAMQISAAVREQWQVAVEPGLVFIKPTLAEYTETVVKLTTTEIIQGNAAIERSDASENLPLSFGQQSLWALQQLYPETTAYHIAGAIRITGHVDVNTVRSAFTGLMLRHDSLRSVFKAEDGLASINILTDCDLPFIYHDLTNYFDAEAEAQVLAETAVLTPFALAEQPAWRLVVIKRAEHDYELNLVLHHLIADGWSMNLLLSEFAELYQAELNGVSAERAKLPIRYADYARWQRAWTQP